MAALSAPILAFIPKLAIWLLVRLSGVAGIVYLLRSVRRLMTYGTWRYRCLNLIYYLGILSIIVWFQGETLLLLYWIIPLCTWFIFTNLLRIAGEHSAIEAPHEFYCLTRTTLPSWFDQLFIVPRHISYHLEHHLYPHIPF